MIKTLKVTDCNIQIKRGTIYTHSFTDCFSASSNENYNFEHCKCNAAMHWRCVEGFQVGPLRFNGLKNRAPKNLEGKKQNIVIAMQ